MTSGQTARCRMLSDMLRPYRIKPVDVKKDGINRKGYLRADFEPVWKSYLPGGYRRYPATKLSNKDKKVAPVAPVAPGAEDEGYPEPAAYEPDFDERAA